MVFESIPSELVVICAGLFGLVFGSFLHVCVVRIPHEISIVFPSSACPVCHQAIAWYDNIPLLSYLLLRGKCRHCQTGIPFRYPLFEALTALLFMGIVQAYGLSSTAFLYLFLTCVWLVASGIDWDYQYIPDRLSLPLIPLSLIIAALAQWTPYFQDALVRSLSDGVIGLLVGGGLIWAIRIIGTWYFQQEAMGFGDVKLMAYVGAFLGWQNTLLCIFLASFMGSIVGVSLKWRNQIEKYGHIPFGPYLAFGAYLCLLYGKDLIQWYLAPFHA
ncbi:MAG: prepilin peptidase [bacterium]|nr:prepilin peptidase [bacterium]